MSAEQAAAETYRQMFRDGNFYVEFYEGNENNRLDIIAQARDIQALGAKDGRRIYIRYMDLKDKFPFAAMYQDGKYYNFNVERGISSNIFIGQHLKSTVRVLVLPEEQINSPNLDPKEYWRSTRSSLSLPDELAIFYWNDPPFQPRNYDAPVYLESSKLTFGGKEYDCDKYVEFAKDMAGNVINETVYNALYENGKLVMVQKYFLRDGKERLIETVNIKNITSQVPDIAFAIDKATKIYKPKNGDMNDLLNEYQEIGEIGGKKK